MRAATLADVPAMIDMARAEFEPRFQLPGGDVERAMAAIAACIVGGGAFIAEGGFVLGTMGQTPWSAAPVAEEAMLYVRPEHRGSGLAQALMEALEGWASAQGATVLRVTAQPGQAAAAALYGRLGFEPAEQAFLKRL